MRISKQLGLWLFEPWTAWTGRGPRQWSHVAWARCHKLQRAIPSNMHCTRMICRLVALVHGSLHVPHNLLPLCQSKHAWGFQVAHRDCARNWPGSRPSVYLSSSWPPSQRDCRSAQLRRPQCPTTRCSVRGMMQIGRTCDFMIFMQTWAWMIMYTRIQHHNPNPKLQGRNVKHLAVSVWIEMIELKIVSVWIENCFSLNWND